MTKTNKRLTIGYFNQILNDEWSVLPWTGIVNTARKHDVSLISFHGNSILDKNEFNEQGNTIYDLAKGEKLDGLITWRGNITVYMNETEILDFCNQYNIPIVTIEGSIKGYPCVTYAGYKGMHMIVEHLINVHNFKKIAFIGLIENQLGFQERYQAFNDTMKAHSLTVESNLVKSWAPWSDNNTGYSINEVLDDWLKIEIKSGLQAIIGSCDPIALWIIEHLENLGIHVPDDIAVTGYDGFTQSKIANPPLTTINPSWIELGEVACNTIIKLINGENIPEKTVVVPSLVIGRSCGCMEENLNFAGTKVLNHKLFGNKKIINEMVNVLKEKTEENITQTIKNLFEIFINEIKGKVKNNFLKELENILRKSFKERKEIILWQDVISVLQKNLKLLLNKQKLIDNANILCHQARILINNTVKRLQARQTKDIQERINNQLNLSMSLITTFELDKLMDLLTEGLPKLGISSCYVSLYENPKIYQYPDPVPEWSQLVLAYNKKGRIKLEKDGLRFNSREIVPEKIWPRDKACSFFVKPLYFRENQIGFIVFETNLLIGNFYNFLSKQISSALQGTLLIKQINNHSFILESGISDLSSSIEEMVKNIESIKNNMSNQENAVEEEAGAIEQMKGNINNISEVSNNSLNISNELDNIAGESVKSIKNLITSIQDIEEKSQNISKILNLIQDIADTTKLLSFNATIEAVRAGERGKGFYIVAKEISKLAEDTNNNIKGIEGVLNILMNKINESAEFSKKIISGLDKIIYNSKHNTEISNQLNLAMIEQKKGTDEILLSTNKLVNITSVINNAMSEQMLITKEFKNALLNLQKITKTKN